MKMKFHKPAKTQQEKATQTRSKTISIVSIASVVVVFSLVASKALLSEASHQRHIITGRHTAINQLKSDIAAFNTLSNQYQAFNANATNIVGGNSQGTGSNDGPNSQIVLDALPSKYDFPGLTASVEKLLSNRGVKLQAITGTDTASTSSSTPQANPQPQAITISFTASTTFNGARRLFDDFQKSIRPFQITSLQLSGSDGNLTVTATMNTYYQPPKLFTVTTKGVK